MLANTHAVTGIRFGVIACQNLDPDLVDTLMFGPQAINAAYEDMLSNYRSSTQKAWLGLVDEAKIAAAESGADRELGYDEDDWIEKWFERQGHGASFDYVDRVVERELSDLDVDEPVYEGVFEGVTYSIAWLGGAPILCAKEGPVGYANSLCSPCVPNAADLDSGFGLQEHTEGGWQCYVVPQDWLAI